MKELVKLLDNATSIIKDYPLTSIVLGLIGLLILIARHFHYYFIVYPQLGGRHNDQNYKGYRHPREKQLQSQDIQIQIENNMKLRGWYIKNRSPRQLFIFYHQNAGNIGGRLYYVDQIMEKTNASVLLVSYRGFSDSDGDQKPNQCQIMKDAIAILKKGMQIAYKEKLPLFVFGRSLGGAAAIHVLSRKQFRHAAKGLILQNTFTSIYDVASNFLPSYLYPLRALLWLVTSNSYESISKIKDLQIPILFIKGRKDQLVPAALMDELQRESEFYKKCQNFSLQVSNGQHNDTWYKAGDSYFKTINDFMNYCQ